MSATENDSLSYHEALEQTRLALAETQALYQVARSLITFPDLPSLLQTVVDTVAEALPANRVILITFDLETQQVTNFMKGGVGIKYVVEVSFDELWDGLSGWTLRELMPVLSPKSVSDPRESPEVQRRRLETNCGAIIVVPLYYHSRVLGTMTAINDPKEREFTERDVELMMAMGSQSAVAIENARLFKELQSTNAELEQRVAERTIELAETNVRLQAEIAERDRVAQALRTSEERYRLLVENMNDGLAVISQDLVFTYTNRKFCDLLGYTSGELIGQPLRSFLDPANRKIFDEHIARRQKGERSVYELKWITKYGHGIFTLVSGTPTLGNQGEFQGSFAVVTDITERKHAEEELRASEERFSKAFRLSPIGMAIFRAVDGCFVDVNDVFVKISGYDRDEIIGHDALELQLYADPEERVSILQALRERGYLEAFEFKTRSKSGELGVGLGATTETNIDGEKHYLSLVLDITERKKMEKALGESEQKYRTIFEESFDGLFITSPGGKILDMNKKGVMMFGYDTKEELLSLDLGKDIYAYPPDRNRILAMVNAQGTAEYEVVVKKKNGEQIIAHCSLTAVKDEKGAIATYRGIIRDITERKRAEEGLRESEAKYRTLIQKIQAAVVVHGADTRILTHNPLAEKLLGLTEDQLLGKTAVDPIWHFFREDGTVMPVAEYPVNRVLATHQPLRDLIVGIHRSDRNTDVWALVNADPVFGKENEIAQVIVTFIDITERKHAEEALRESEEHARGFQEKLKALNKISLELAAVESLEHLCRRAIELGHSSLGYDRIGLLLFDNAEKSRVSRFGIESTRELRVEQGMSYDSEEDPVYGLLTNREDVFASEDANLGDFETVVGRGWNVMVGIWDASASIGWLAADNLFEKQPLIPYQIELLKLYGLTLGHLVTRKRAEESLRRYNQRLSVLRGIDRDILLVRSFDTLAHAVLEQLVQLIPCEFTSVILHNDELTEEQVFAWNLAPDIHVLTKTIQPVVPNQVLERLKSGQTAITADLRTQEGPLALLAADLMSQGVHSAMANPMMIQGRLIGTLALASREVGFFTPEHQQIGEEVAAQVAIAFHQAKLHDQIARHNTELEQRVRERTMQLENANRELELFSYSVSHDLRAPLRAIQGFAEIVARRHRETLNEEGRHYFDNIITASEQMNQLITDLLDYIRLGRQHIRLTTIQLDDVISEVVNNLMPQIEESSAQIQLADNLPDVLGDSTLLKRIFTNLLENALVYHRTNIPPIVTIGYAFESAYVVIRVRDNGIGIPLEFREKIFDIFQRLHSEDQYPGTGIGLAIVRKSAEMLKGTVWVEAASEMGSVFCIKLPCSAEREK